MQIVAALIEALRLRGVRRVYGVPGDYVLGLFAALQASPIDLICTPGRRGPASPPMPTGVCRGWAWRWSPTASVL